MTARLLIGDVFDRLADIPDGSVDVVVTSPPFLALRSYLPADHPDKGKEIGSEPTPAAFLDTLLDLTTEWRRVLAPHGSICVELGDTYSGSGGAGGDYNAGGLRDGQAKFDGSNHRLGRIVDHNSGRRTPGPDWPQAKSLCGIPTLYAWSLAYGRNLLNPAHECEPWRIRNLIAWTRPNPPVGALGDKVRPATSYVTTACVGGSRYFDLDGERVPFTGHAGVGTGVRKGQGGAQDHDNRPDDLPTRKNTHEGAPLLDWWAIPTQPYVGSHYATFPEELPRRLISLMCPQRVCTVCGEPSRRLTDYSEDYKQHLGSDMFGEHHDQVMRRTSGRARADGQGNKRITAEIVTLGWSDCDCEGGGAKWRPGVVLDPFAGSGTTLAVAVGMGREAIGIDIDERNAYLCEQRVGMFLEVDHLAESAGCHECGADLDNEDHDPDCPDQYLEPATIDVPTGTYL